jgi:hypothetical protein
VAVSSRDYPKIIADLREGVTSIHFALEHARLHFTVNLPRSFADNVLLPLFEPTLI